MGRSIVHNDLVVDRPPSAHDRPRPAHGRPGVTFGPPCVGAAWSSSAAGTTTAQRRQAGPPAQHATAWRGDRHEAVRSRRSVPSATSVVGHPELGGFLLHVAFVGLAAPLLNLGSVCVVPVLGAHALRARGRTIRLPSVSKKQPTTVWYCATDNSRAELLKGCGDRQPQPIGPGRTIDTNHRAGLMPCGLRLLSSRPHARSPQADVLDVRGDEDGGRSRVLFVHGEQLSRAEQN